jgi:hypothetical protein
LNKLGKPRIRYDHGLVSKNLKRICEQGLEFRDLRKVEFGHLKRIFEQDLEFRNLKNIEFRSLSTTSDAVSNSGT